MFGSCSIYVIVFQLLRGLVSPGGGYSSDNCFSRGYFCEKVASGRSSRYSARRRGPGRCFDMVGPARQRVPEKADLVRARGAVGAALSRVVSSAPVAARRRRPVRRRMTFVPAKFNSTSCPGKTARPPRFFSTIASFFFLGNLNFKHRTTLASSNFFI